MENKTILNLKNIQVRTNDSRFVQLVVHFLIKQANIINSHEEKYTDKLSRIDLILQQLEIARSTKDDAGLRNVCIKAKQGLPDTIWQQDAFKQGLLDIIQSDIPLAISASQELIMRITREKLNLVNVLKDIEESVQQLITDNSQLKAKVLVLEADIPVIKKQTELEKKYNSELGIENKKLNYSITVKEKRILQLEAMLKSYTSVNATDDFIASFNKTMPKIAFSKTKL